MSDSKQTYVLVHGFLGFDIIGIPGAPIHYFRNVSDTLEDLGVNCLVADGLPAAGSVASRAEALRKFLAKHDIERCVLIGHSMGGLDSRHLIARLDDEQRVRCLITLGTPHHGTALAKWALDGHGPFASSLRAIGLDGLRELTPEACAIRNDALPDRPDIRYLSVAGARPAGEQNEIFRTFFPDLMDDEGPHDGLVSVKSAEWGEFIRVVAADHFELVGWDLSATNLPGFRMLPLPRREPFDHLALYRELVAITASSGEA